MAIRKVTPTGGGGSAYVILPKDGLEDDEIIDEDGEVREQYAHVERTGTGEYQVQLLDV